jgi:hypothetical protein
MEYQMVVISSVSPVAYRENPQAIQRSKKPGLIDKVGMHASVAFDYASKAASLVQGSAKVVGGFTKVPHGLGEFTTALKSIKIIKGMLAVEDIIRAVVKLVKATTLKSGVSASWKVIVAADKIVGAVETIFSYLKELKVLSSASLAWTSITGYVFLPVSIISTGIAGYQLAGQSKFMTVFNASLKQLKVEHAASSHTLATKVCQELLVQEIHLKKFKIITKSCPLKSRLEGIVARLASDKIEEQKEAAAEVKFIKKCLKDRVREQVGIAAVRTSVATAGVACTIIGLACPPAAPVLAIVGLVLTVVGIANFAYSKFVSKGDVQAGEKRMVFAKARKGIQKATRALSTSCTRFAQRLQNIAKIKFKQKAQVPA